MGEFKGSMTPEALIKAIETKGTITVPDANTLVERLNKLLERQDLYQVMEKQPNEAEDLINRLKQGQQLSSYKIKRLNRLIMEANYPLETPKSLKHKPQVNTDGHRKSRQMIFITF